MSLLIVDLDAKTGSRNPSDKIIWVSKCWSSKFRIKLVVHFCDIWHKLFLWRENLYLMLPLLSAGHKQSWAISTCSNVESICVWEGGKLLCELRAERKGKQQIKGKRLGSKTEFHSLLAVDLEADFSSYSHILRLQ